MRECSRKRPTTERTRNSIGKSLDAGAEDGESADDEVDFDAGLRGLIKSLNDGGLEQGVHLGDDVRGAAGLGVFLLAADEAEEALGHGERRDQQGTVVVDSA